MYDKGSGSTGTTENQGVGATHNQGVEGTKVTAR
jgi:hypothetical protein